LAIGDDWQLAIDHWRWANGDGGWRMQLTICEGQVSRPTPSWWFATGGVRRCPCGAFVSCPGAPRVRHRAACACQYRGAGMNACLFLGPVPAVKGVLQSPIALAVCDRFPNRRSLIAQRNRYRQSLSPSANDVIANPYRTSQSPNARVICKSLIASANYR